MCQIQKTCFQCGHRADDDDDYEDYDNTIFKCAAAGRRKRALEAEGIQGEYRCKFMQTVEVMVWRLCRTCDSHQKRTRRRTEREQERAYIAAYNAAMQRRLQNDIGFVDEGFY